jgi:hypothetical protein
VTAAGIEVRELDAGCCGLAGGFGYRDGEPYEVSVAAGERALAPAVREAPAATILLADGSSCRTQVAHLQDREGPRASSDPPRRPLHLAELLAGLLDGEVRTDVTTDEAARVGSDRDRQALLTLGAVGGVGVAIGSLARRAGRRRTGGRRSSGRSSGRGTTQVRGRPGPSSR